MQVKSIAECSKGRILQYFRPSLPFVIMIFVLSIFEWPFDTRFHVGDMRNPVLFVCFVCFVALRPKSIAMVIAGRSVHLTTLFPGQA